MDTITTVTMPATSLRAALLERSEAFGSDLTGSNPALCALGASKRPESKRVASPVHDHEAFAASTPRIAFGAAYAGQRRPQPSRFFPLSHSGQVS